VPADDDADFFDARRGLLAWVAVVLVVAVLASCSGDDDDSASTTTTTSGKSLQVETPDGQVSLSLTHRHLPG
jgi:hypothetical protein